MNNENVLISDAYQALLPMVKNKKIHPSKRPDLLGVANLAVYSAYKYLKKQNKSLDTLIPLSVYAFKQRYIEYVRKVKVEEDKFTLEFHSSEYFQGIYQKSPTINEVECRDMFRHALSHMTPLQREIAQLYFIEQYNKADIRRKLNLYHDILAREFGLMCDTLRQHMEAA